MLIRSRRLQSAAGRLKPQQKTESKVWPFWVAVIIGWNVVPILGFTRPLAIFAMADAAAQPGMVAVRAVASGLGVACLAMTIVCWVQMRESWGIATIPGVKTRLIRDGMYSLVRHPIYALSVVLMALTAIVVPSLPMIVIAVLHITFMNIKASTEESELLKIHGDDYERMCALTGRFIPRLRRLDTRPLSAVENADQENRKAA